MAGVATRLFVVVLAPVKGAGSSPMARGTLTGTLGSPQLRNTGQGEDDALSITTSAMLQTGDMLPKKRTTLNSGFNTASGLFGTATSPDALGPEGRLELRATFMTGGATARRNSGLRAFYNAIAQEVALTKVGGPIPQNRKVLQDALAWTCTSLYSSLRVSTWVA